MLSKQKAGLAFGPSFPDERELAGDILLLDDWENGLVPWLSAFVPVSQIRFSGPWTCSRVPRMGDEGNTVMRSGAGLPS